MPQSTAGDEVLRIHDESFGCVVAMAQYQPVAALEGGTGRGHKNGTPIGRVMEETGL